MWKRLILTKKTEKETKHIKDLLSETGCDPGNCECPLTWFQEMAMPELMLNQNCKNNTQSKDLIEKKKRGFKFSIIFGFIKESSLNVIIKRKYSYNFQILSLQQSF